MITVAELVRLGIPERTVYRRTQQDGPWTLLLPGTILLSEEIAAILTEPVQRRMVLREALIAELDAGTRRGTAAARRILGAIADGVESPNEFVFHQFWKSVPGLPTVRCNVPVYDLTGRRVGITDFLVDELGFVWECDSVAEHFATPEQVLKTAERARAFREVGLYLLSTRPQQLRDDPRGVETDIRQGLEIATTMPPPRVTYGRPRAA